MKKDYDFSKWDWMDDNDFMTYNDLILRLRKDLNDPEFFAYDLFVPHDEEEYQEVLESTREMMEIIRKRKGKTMTLKKLVEMEKRIMNRD
ncbi:hypothetical protein QAS_4092 [Clostridioides difficile CD9]|uniref:hypothetical protein n=1 Tax=Clostridioides difficile TaxID=1496 RepID=UPI00038C8EE1|nr:hypothetical protein [Clostridioides difficile]EQE00565.1 hypothetical protein QAS_4092 [Clostridioides difficile CD9]